MKITVDVLNINNVKKAFVIADNAIYFDANSEYTTALYEVCMALKPDVDPERTRTKYKE